MAHGKKKFIEAYDGRIKRSNDRTKKDYYRGLKWWNEFDYAYSKRYKKEGQKNDPNFCPQCKHVQKHVRDIEQENRAHRDRLHALYMKEHGIAVEAWDKWKRERWLWTTWMDRRQVILKNAPVPKMPQPPSFFSWLDARGDSVWGSYRDFDTRSFLCYKHERDYETKREMWRWYAGYGGYKSHYTYTRRMDYKYYKNEVKSIMQKAKYDEEYYDDIPVYKHGWLD